MDTQLTFALLQVVFALCAVVLIFMSFRIIVNEMKKDFVNESEKAVKKSFMRAIKRCMKYICGGFLFYVLTKLCRTFYFSDMPFADALLKAFIDTAVGIGYIVLIPYVLMYWKLSALRKANKKD